MMPARVETMMVSYLRVATSEFSAQAPKPQSLPLPHEASHGRNQVLELELYGGSGRCPT